MPGSTSPDRTAAGHLQALANAFLSQIFAKFTTFVGLATFAHIRSHICKAASIRSQIRRIGHMHKNIRSQIRRDFSTRPHSQGFAAPDIRKAACIHRTASTSANIWVFSAHSVDFLAPRRLQHVCLNIRSQIKENPGSPSQETGE